MAFNENTRVKIPAILHLCRLGYEYLSLKGLSIDEHTNILKEIFETSIRKLNPSTEHINSSTIIDELKILADAEDLGRSFYNRLNNQSMLKLIDFENFENNQFNVITELTYKNGEEEFRPDITLFVNGIPLVFIEVKKPNNKEGILDERNRLNRRFQNKKFHRFVNFTQFMIFSNNMEYENEDIDTIQGAFYATSSYKEPKFNYFREEDEQIYSKLAIESDETEDFVLQDNNLTVIKYSDEFLTNKNPLSPTNRILSSLCSRDRLNFILKYALVYLENENGQIEKHIMRYPQIFATKAIANTIESNTKRGIIWHTQGSGKTALAFYNVQYLTDVFRKKGIIPKFYFIVDRIDLANQAQKEFKSRGLSIHTVNSRLAFVNDMKSVGTLHNNSGKNEITVVNIQKFTEDATAIVNNDYDISIQRIYFLDEVHRSYNPKGSFLSNLTNSDKNAIFIGLTGTPLITKNLYSKDIFGDYIHKYYYNASIKDGYTLRLIREEIETNYKVKLEEILNQIEVLKGDLDKKFIFSHPQFVEPMLDYIITDFEKSRMMFGDETIGGMVVCDSTEQAKALFDVFNEKYSESKPLSQYSLAAEPQEEYKGKFSKFKVKNAALILSDLGTKEDRERQVDDFKAGKIDFLFVYNMLLTGFDAKRLKKLYLGRVIRDHNLLQALTRVNRPYKEFKYGYVVDFADIRKEFDSTNKAYFDELQIELGDEAEHYSYLFKSKEEIEDEIKHIRDVLFQYDIKNAEIFSQQISQIQDRAQMLEIKKALASAKYLYNLIRYSGYSELLERLDFKKLNQLYTEASNHLDLLNTKEALENSIDNTNLLNVALEDIIFKFRKVSEGELIIADQLKDTLRKTREALNSNFDKADPEFITLYEELKRLFDKKNLEEITQEEMKANIGALRKIFEKISELNRKNNLLKAKYENDAKYARLHKRMVERGTISKREIEIFDALGGVKKDADLQVLLNNGLLKNESYFEGQMVKLVIENFISKNKMNLDAETTKAINQLIVKEYTNEFYGIAL